PTDCLVPTGEVLAKAEQSQLGRRGTVCEQTVVVVSPASLDSRSPPPGVVAMIEARDHNQSGQAAGDQDRRKPNAIWHQQRCQGGERCAGLKQTASTFEECERAGGNIVPNLFKLILKVTGFVEREIETHRVLMDQSLDVVLNQLRLRGASPL